MDSILFNFLHYEVEFEETIRHWKDSLSDKQNHDYEKIPSRPGGLGDEIDRERLRDTCLKTRENEV